MPPSLRALVAAVALPAAPGVAAEPVDYARDVRPILSNVCFKCHGPGTAKGGLRLDNRDKAIAKEALVPGKPDMGSLFERIALPDTDDGRMPPPESGPRLTPAQVDILKRWVAQGAEYAPHWAFAPVRRAAVPAGADPVDHFVDARLRKGGLSPAPEADRPTLIRRLSLDLVGLLPSPKEVDDFVNDPSPDAYEKLVDRLLASPHYGERQARHWLDLARYADSNGYTIDGPRSVWPYRDWVIRAFNTDMPFDRFTVEQLAGDLLPKPTPQQLTATGFHRNTAFNEEGGSDPEQFRVERTVDRANTTGAVWLGLTVGCAQCHDHKFDPVSQKEYFQLYAFFNSVDEPTLPLGGSDELQQKVNDLTAKMNELSQAGKVDAAKKVGAEIRKATGLLPSTLVLKERKTVRPTHVQIRGDFLRKGDEVKPGTPAVLPPLVTAKGRSATRLDLAKWIVSGDNPLTPRVVVNREWQKFFGRGLVETENDFGTQGNLPTHPELLDWLSAAFVQDGAWSLKKLHRRIVLSATYRRASDHRADLQAKDPRNLLLARQSRLRLEAEVIRDAALSASGTLSPTVGGPGVYPPQPPEVFSFTQSKRVWPESRGADRFRRGMYTYIWRQAQHPLLTTFDGADAQTACTRRNRSNTPLQALHLANDPVFVELAAALGKRIEKDGPADDAGRVALAFKLCFARTPTAAESERVLAYLKAEQKTDPKTAWASVGRVLINLDEFVTRE